jgi:AcrR family transcriptional regulator
LSAESVSPTPQERTRERILEGAKSAIARHGLAKVGMTDVSRSCGLSRGTLYRYFPTREKLLAELVARESDRFRGRLLAELGAAEPGADRVRAAIEHAARLTREHPVLQRLLETDSGFVLGVIRDQLPLIRTTVQELLGPVLEESSLVRSGVVRSSQLVDWTTRIMISAYLFPAAHPSEMAESLAAVHRALTLPRSDG